MKPFRTAPYVAVGPRSLKVGDTVALEVMEPGVWHFPNGLPGTPLITSLWVYLSPADSRAVKFVQEGTGFTYGAQERDKTPAPEFQMPFRVLVDRDREDYLFKITYAAPSGFDFICTCTEAIRIGDELAEEMKFAAAGKISGKALLEAAGFDYEREQMLLRDEEERMQDRARKMGEATAEEWKKQLDAAGVSAMIRPGLESLDAGEGARPVKLIEERLPFQGRGADRVPYLLSKETVLVDIGLEPVICTFRKGMFVLSGRVPADLLPELVERFDSRVFSSLLLASVQEFLQARDVPVNTEWWARVIRTMRRQEINGWKPGQPPVVSDERIPAIAERLTLELPGDGRLPPLASIPGLSDEKLVEKLQAAGWKIGLQVEPVEEKDEGKEEEAPPKKTRRFDWD